MQSWKDVLAENILPSSHMLPRSAGICGCSGSLALIFSGRRARGRVLQRDTSVVLTNFVLLILSLLQFLLFLLCFMATAAILPHLCSHSAPPEIPGWSSVIFIILVSIHGVLEFFFILHSSLVFRSFPPCSTGPPISPQTVKLLHSRLKMLDGNVGLLPKVLDPLHGLHCPIMLHCPIFSPFGLDILPVHRHWTEACNLIKTLAYKEVHFIVLTQSGHLMAEKDKSFSVKETSAAVKYLLVRKHSGLVKTLSDNLSGGYFL